MKDDEEEEESRACCIILIYDAKIEKQSLKTNRKLHIYMCFFFSASFLFWTGMPFDSLRSKF